MTKLLYLFGITISVVLSSLAWQQAFIFGDMAVICARDTPNDGWRPSSYWVTMYTNGPTFGTKVAEQQLEYCPANGLLRVRP